MSDPNLAAFLSAAPEVAAIAADRHYLLKIPQQHRDSEPAYPCTVFLTVNVAREGELCGTTDVPTCNAQIDSYALTPEAARALARAIRRAIVDYSGPMGEVVVQRAQITADFDSLDPEPGLYRRTQTFNLWYVET